jgi:hypothetical protein
MAFCGIGARISGIARDLIVALVECSQRNTERFIALSAAERCL